VSANNSYLVAGSKPWNKRVFDEVISRYQGEWSYVDSPEQLDRAVQRDRPRYIFFLHWSWRVPKEIVHGQECVCFHMADVPYGRGGSPLQNLIVLGHRKSILSALRMVDEFDAGPVYLKEELSLEGGAEEVYIRATYLSAKMIRTIVEEEPTPQPQEGEAMLFRRRMPSESQIPKLSSVLGLFDFIRMLDAEGYPRAFLEHNGFRYKFSRPALYDGRVAADVTITRLGDET